ncbi:hypothetical protein BX616_004904 [Lobosporangium transversale]|uniref:Uncharacterized protein n=1 Tax=Lobosporangium transversale TaxID=64571 RepID=A0A1Y2GFY3_9FUNG|nr:hypothetical protein BCR41DRAFT_358401 [Lobosporangium transversale]KAF9915985.1 hypothetical protein BX616_004904 [Lobosporangium transversale]ORZ09741.1 hypothetical protein BCR41DRAFT_358401 [Lobosporangium transversale]|eukprot:XP_021879011.1 hypothetical protein BCR41DRAFT_358401 [Lobosporangium transversale]
MKRLRIELQQSLNEAVGYYLPGDTVEGQVLLTTSSSIKYTCLRIHLIGTVTTKVAKVEEQIYVMNQQVVLLGNKDNSAEYLLDEGKHSWAFQFLIPPQHVPSSGKYRHGVVKYSLNAALTSEGIVLGMQELKTSHTILVKDLINVNAAPYNTPTSIKGSSNLKPKGSNSKDVATAIIKLSRTAYLKGQKLQLEIDLYHPTKLQRNPGCFIQLICKEDYFAGEHAKEYVQTIATRAEPLVVKSNTRTGKIISELTIPDTATPTLLKTKTMSIDYYLAILFDMRPKTSFLESRHSKTLKSAMKNKLLASPGGFEVKVPIVIGTMSNNSITQSISLEHTQMPELIQSQTQQLQQLQPVRNDLSSNYLTPFGSPSGSPATSLPSSIPSSNAPSMSGRLPSTNIPPNIADYTSGRVQGREDSIGYNSLAMIASGHVNRPSLAPPLQPPMLYPATRSRSYSAVPLFQSSHPSSSSSHSTNQHLNSPAELISKPLPEIPQSPSQSQAQFLPINFTNPSVSASSTRSTLASTLRPFEMSLPAIGLRWSETTPYPETGTSPRPPVQSSFRPGNFMALNHNGYPVEKENATQQLNLPLPISLSVERPTAPHAVDLGLGPASPTAEHAQIFPSSRRYSDPATPSRGTTNGAKDYFTAIQSPSVSLVLTPVMAAPSMTAISTAPSAPYLLNAPSAPSLSNAPNASNTSNVPNA